MLWYRVTVSGSQRHTPTQKYTEIPLPWVFIPVRKASFVLKIRTSLDYRLEFPVQVHFGYKRYVSERFHQKFKL